MRFLRKNRADDAGAVGFPAAADLKSNCRERLAAQKRKGTSRLHPALSAGKGWTGLFPHAVAGAQESGAR
jgi:hypothetical protein